MKSHDLAGLIPKSMLLFPVTFIRLYRTPCWKTQWNEGTLYLGIDWSEHRGCPSRLNPTDAEGLRPWGQVGVWYPVGNLVRHGRWTLPVEPWPFFYLEKKKEESASMDRSWFTSQAGFCVVTCTAILHPSNQIISESRSSICSASKICKKLFSVRVNNSIKNI